MNCDEFREDGKRIVDFIADYHQTLRQRPVRHQVEKGFLVNKLEQHAPKTPVSFEEMMKDLESDIVPGLLHWQHPHFHGYVPGGHSFAALCGDMLSGGLGVVGFSWETSPAIEELERVTIDWLARMLKLPDEFLSNDQNTRGGIITGSASEAALMAVLAARSRQFKREKMKLKGKTLSEESARIFNLNVTKKLVAYCSEESHFSVDRACRIAMVQLRSLKTDSNKVLRGDRLAKAVAKDRKCGKIPFFCMGTVGTTGLGACDNIAELGLVAQKNNLWLHIDAAYAGTACICPEYRPLLNGVEHAMSFNFNPHKWLYVNFDCSALWYRDAEPLTAIFQVDVPYVPQGFGYDNWHIPMCRRFRALKLWFVLRMYGVEKLQERVRDHCRLAQLFKEKLDKDSRFEVLNISLGIINFRVVPKNREDDKNRLTILLYKEIHKRSELFLSKSRLKDEDLDFLRLTLCHEYVDESTIQSAYNKLVEHLTFL